MNAVYVSMHFTTNDTRGTYDGVDITTLCIYWDEGGFIQPGALGF